MEESDHEPADWMLGWRVPPSFSAYCRIFHPVWLSVDPTTVSGPDAAARELGEMTPGLRDLPPGTLVSSMGPQGVSGAEHPVKWSALLMEANGAFDPEIGYWDLRKSGLVPDAAPLPNEGILDAPFLARAIDILTAHAGTENCHAYFTCPPTQFMCPDKPMWAGLLADVPAMVKREMDGCSPTYLWPDDMAWCLNTNTDGHSTVVGGTDAAIAALLHTDLLDAFAVSSPES